MFENLTNFLNSLLLSLFRPHMIMKPNIILNSYISIAFIDPHYLQIRSSFLQRKSLRHGPVTACFWVFKVKWQGPLNVYWKVHQRPGIALLENSHNVDEFHPPPVYVHHSIVSLYWVLTHSSFFEISKRGYNLWGYKLEHW